MVQEEQDAVAKKTWPRRALEVLAALGLLVLALGLYAAWEGGWTFVHPRNPAEQPALPEVDRHFSFACGDAILDTVVLFGSGERHPDAVHTALVLHGKADQKNSMMGLGRRFVGAGVQVVLVDMRGHGRSSALPLTYGVRDRGDLSCVLDGLEEAEIELGELGVYGASYGGIVALHFAGTDPRVRRAVAVAAARSFEASARTMIKLPSLAQWAVIQAAGIRGGFSIGDASVEEAIRGTQADIVLVYSRDDEIVPYEHGLAVAEACGEHCRLVTFEGYDHLGTLSNAPLRDLLHRHLAARPFPPPEPEGAVQ